MIVALDAAGPPSIASPMENPLPSVERPSRTLREEEPIRSMRRLRWAEKIEVDSDATESDSAPDTIALPGPMKGCPSPGHPLSGYALRRALKAARQRKSVIFSALTKPEQQELLAGVDAYGKPNCWVEMVEGNGSILCQDEDTSGVALVVAGHVSVWRSRRTDGEVHSEWLREGSVGDIFAEEEWGAGLKSRFTVLASPPRCEVVRVSAAAMLELLEKHPPLRSRLADRLAAGGHLLWVSKPDEERALLAATIGGEGLSNHTRCRPPW